MAKNHDAGKSWRLVHFLRQPARHRAFFAERDSAQCSRSLFLLQFLSQKPLHTFRDNSSSRHMLNLQPDSVTTQAINKLPIQRP